MNNIHHLSKEKFLLVNKLHVRSLFLFTPWYIRNQVRITIATRAIGKSEILRMRSLYFVFLVISNINSAFSQSVIGGPVINPNNGHQYYLLSSDSWTNSEAMAVTLGGHLVTINDQVENDFVYSTFSTFGGEDRSLWVGLSDQISEGQFLWSSGEPFTYSHWLNGEPNNCINEDYVHFFSPSFNPTGVWNDIVNIGSNCGISYNHYGIVEIPAVQCAGNAIHFDGINDYVNIGSTPSLELISEFTIEAWIYPTGPGSNELGRGGIIVNREGEYEIARWGDGVIQFALANSIPSWDWINTGYIAQEDTWLHISWTYSALAGIIKVYANGIEIYSTPGSGNIGDFATGEEEFRIGNRQNTSPPNLQFFEGGIDEVRVWDVALSQSIIQQWMNKSIDTVHPEYANLIGYWKLDEGAGISTGDASANSNIGTLTNSPVWIASTAPIDGFIWYADSDNDGYGSASHTVSSCDQPNAYVSDNTDCDDNSNAVYPGAIELCNAIDDNCDGSIDESMPQIEWDKTYGGTSDDIPNYSCSKQTTDGGYITGGYSNSAATGDKSQASQGGNDYWILKTDANGIKQWDKRFGGSDDDILYSLEQTSDGGYILGGRSRSGIGGDKSQDSRGNYDYWIVKIDAAGVKQWDARFGGSDADIMTQLLQTSDGGYVLAGFSASNVGGDKTQPGQGGNDYWVLKLDGNGIKQWDARFGGNAIDNLTTIVQSDDGYLLAGYSSSGVGGDKSQVNQGGIDYWIVKTDLNGTKQWDKRFGGNGDDFLFSLKSASDGGYLLGGYTTSDAGGDKTQISQGANDYWVIKVDSNFEKMWDKRFGGSLDDYLFSVDQTEDGGFILGGYSSSGITGDKTQASQGGTDFWIVKTNATGTKQWDARFGGTSDDYFATLNPTTEAGYVLLGYSLSGIGGDKTQGSQGGYDFWLIKTGIEPLDTFYLDGDGDGFGDAGSTTLACAAPNGYVNNTLDCDDTNASINPNGLPIKQWDARFGGTGDDKLYKVQQTSDGGYISGGRSKSGLSGDRTQANWDGTNSTWDFWVVKTNSSGVKQWDKRYGGTKNDEMIAFQQTADGGYIFGGPSASGINGDKTQANYDATEATTDYWVVKTDANGVKQWDFRYGGTGDDQFQDIHRTSDGGYILGGYSNSGISGDKSQASQGNYDYWIVKINSAGVKQWDARYGGSNADYLYDLQTTADGGYILGGRSYSGVSGDKTQANWDGTNATFDYWIVKTDASGLKQWDKRFGGTSDDYFYALKQATDGGYVVAGYSNSLVSGDKTQGSQGTWDYWMVKIDGSGVKQWDKRFGGTGDDQLYLVELSLDGGYLLGGYSASGISGDKTQSSQGNRDYWVVKTDNTGAKTWDLRWGGSKIDVATGMQTTSDGGYILGGYSFSGATGDKSQANWDATLVTQDYWLLKLTNGTGQVPFYADNDGDGYGNSSAITLACSAPAGYVADKTDCNDANANIHPNAADLCNSLDDNCNAVVDENAIAATVTPTGAVSTCSGVAVLLTANTGPGITYQWKKGSNNISAATNSTYSTTAAGTYKVVENNSFNCSSTSATTTITVLSNPTATITPLGNLDICATGSVDLQANGGTGLTYQWIKGSNNIAGATNQIYTATKKATYKVKVTNSNGCSKTSAGVKVTKSCKLEEPAEDVSQELSVYPNPTDGKFIIELRLNEAIEEIAIIEVINNIGQKICSEESNVIDGYLLHEISIGRNMPGGDYLLRAILNDRIYTEQIIYQK